VKVITVGRQYPKEMTIKRNKSKMARQRSGKIRCFGRVTILPVMMILTFFVKVLKHHKASECIYIE